MRKQYHTRLVDGVRHTWDVHRLVRLAKALPVSMVPLSEISELDEIWWFQEQDDLPTPRSIAAHFRLMEQADLAHPIILCSEGRLMDGMHRVMKALVEDAIEIAAVRFPQTPQPDFLDVDVAGLPYPDEDV
ncbi:MAG: hypothetical protein AAF468_18640 [Pseudomonadota bacterium]